MCFELFRISVYISKYFVGHVKYHFTMNPTMFITIEITIPTVLNTENTLSTYNRANYANCSILY